MLNTKVNQTKETPKISLKELIPISKVKTINTILFVEYDFAMDLLGKSKHFHQREKRHKKYPHHIISDQNCYYTSLQYLETLYLYNNQAEQLKALKTSL